MPALKLSPVVGDDCETVKIHTFKFPKREELQQLQMSWLSKLDYVPVGNRDTDSVWEAALKDQSKAIDDVERKLQEEKKFKLRKAMADSTLIDELPQVERSAPDHIYSCTRLVASAARDANCAAAQLSDEEKYRRKNLEMAVEGDDWSGEIDRQTAATVAAAAATPAAAAPAEAAAAAVVSPFEGR